MNFEDTIKYCYEVCDMHRTDALHHLFLVNGNGYDWENGELVNRADENDPSKIDYYARCHKQRFGRKLAYSYREDDEVEKYLAKVQNRKYRSVKQRLRNFWKEARIERDKPLSYDYHIYPLSDYSRIMKIPDDIKPDWLAGAFEVIEWAVQLNPDAKMYGERHSNAYYQKQLLEYKNTLISRFCNDSPSICSRHQKKKLDCPLCHAKIWDVLNTTEEEWNAKCAKAEAAGIHKCLKCGFTYYKTIDFCPLCGQTGEK